MYPEETANPFNWVGSKHRYLADLFSVLPKVENISVLDPFVGGGDLISKLDPSWKITASDLMSEVIGLHQAIQDGTITPESVQAVCDAAGLTRTDAAAYNALRETQRTGGDRTPLTLFAIMTSAFNNQIRFNTKGGFNMTFGRRVFNERTRAKLSNYIDALKQRDIVFQHKHFDDHDFGDYDLVIIDPPYLLTDATYNHMAKWTLNDDLRLFDKLDVHDMLGKGFVYFNQVMCKGVQHDELAAWSAKYNVKVLSKTTERCNHQRKSGDGDTIEIMVYNNNLKGIEIRDFVHKNHPASDAFGMTHDELHEICEELL